MTSYQMKIAAGSIIAIIGLGVYCYTSEKNRKIKEIEEQNRMAQLEIDKIKEQQKFPPEYWLAKKAETDASIEKHRIDKESEERLTIDNRNRVDARAEATRTFEMNAPEEYWKHKKVEEEEKTRRHQMDLDDARLYRQAQLERDIAAKNADALVSGAKSLEKAITHASAAREYYTI